jgi:hypothetical protein
VTHEQEARELLAKYGKKYAGTQLSLGQGVALAAIKDALRQRDEARAALVYKGDYDTDDEHTEAILAAHPIKSGDWSHWNAALEMVGNRKSKGSLVMLVNWLLKERDQARERTGPDALCPYPASGQPRGQTVDDCVRLGNCGCLHLHPPHSNYTATLTAQRDKAVEALRPIALISSEGVVSQSSGHVTITTCVEYFHRAAAVVKEIGNG